MTDGRSAGASARRVERPRPGGLAAVLFDMDGLLVDSEPVWTVAETELAERLGRRWTPELKQLVLGTGLDEAVRRILAYFGATDEDPAAVGRWLLTRVEELFRGALPMRPGALRLLDALAEADVPLALVSSSYRVLVDAALDEVGAWRFAVTVAGDEVANTKPHPEPYLTAAARLGARPERCVVFEDSWSGVRSGEAAGCLVVAVPDHVAVEATPTRPVLASLEDVDLDWLLDLPASLRAAT
jgi:HAD superfamily hydrolase (TIGR01509 family)